MEIYTIGFTKKSAAEFFDPLRKAGIGQLIDVRLNNQSQMAGFTRRQDLPYFLAEICDAGYIHEPLLAPTAELLGAYRSGLITWAEYEDRFLALMAERSIESALDWQVLLNRPSVLLCSEAQPEHCHRRLVVEYLERAGMDLTPIHLQTMEIVVDHLTRMAAGYICVAGLDRQGRHIRPVLARGRLPVSLLQEIGGPFGIGTAVDIGVGKPVGTSPEVEDHTFDAAAARVVAAMGPGELWGRLLADAELALVDIFGHDLRNRARGAAVPVGAGRVSLGTLDPGYRPTLVVRQGRVRCLLTDPDYGQLDLSVTDVRLYTQTPEGWVSNDAAIASFQRSLKSDRLVLLSVGLTRPWPSDNPAHWLQVNNLHFQPD